MSIASEIQRLQQAKADLKTAIEAKGVTVPAATTIDGYAALVDQILIMPYDAVVEYLQSDGNAYIDTGIKTTSDIRVEVSFSIASRPNANFAIFGGRIGYANNENTLFYYGNNGATKFGWRYGSEEKATNDGAWTGDYVASNVSAARTMVISGATSATMTAKSATFSIEPTMLIFTSNSNGSATAKNYAVMIKRFKMYNGTTLVRDFIPVRKNSVGYFYDKINDTFYGNAGTGSFTYGNDIT